MSANKAIMNLEKAIKKERRGKFGGMCYELDVLDINEKDRVMLIDYIKQNRDNKRFCNVIVSREASPQYHNACGLDVGDMISFDWE